MIGEVGAYLAIAGVLAALALIASLHPRVSLVLGLVLVAVPVAQVVFFQRRWFYSDGSAAGLVFFVVYAGFGLFCGAIGLFFAAQGARDLSRGSGRRILPDAAANGVAVALVAIAIAVPVWMFRDRDAPKPVRAPAEDERVTRHVEAGADFLLEWKHRWGKRPLALRIPASDLGTRSLALTSDGPREVWLSLAAGAAVDARLVLHRDDSTLDSQLAHVFEVDGAGVHPAVPQSFWVDTSDDGWKLLGVTCNGAPPPGALQCHVPEAPLARYLPAAFRLDQVPLRAVERAGRCTLAFDYRGRPVTLASRGPCFGAQGLRAFVAATTLLDRLGRDTATPPSATATTQRLAAEAAACEAARHDAQQAMNRGDVASSEPQRFEAQCDRVVRAAAPLAAGDPAAAATMLTALQSRLTLGSGITRYLPQLDAFLARAAAERREAVWGHALRAWNSAGSTDAAAKAATRASLEPVLQAAARVLAADDPAFEAAYRAASAAAADESLQPRVLELVRAWDAKAQAAGPETDIALKVRFRLCRERLSSKLEREALGSCADQLLAAWRRRIGEGKGFDIFFDEAELAMHVARMHVSHAWAVDDFAAGAEGLGRVRELAATRFSGAKYDNVFSALQKMHEELSAKAGAARAR